MLACASFAAENMVPQKTFYGTADKTVPFENVERFTKLMKDAGNICTLVPFNGKGHGFFNGSFFRPNNGDDDFNTTMQMSMDFLVTTNICHPSCTPPPKPV